MIAPMGVEGAATALGGGRHDVPAVPGEHARRGPVVSAEHDGLHASRGMAAPAPFSLGRGESRERRPLGARRHGREQPLPGGQRSRKQAHDPARPHETLEPLA